MKIILKITLCTLLTVSSQHLIHAMEVDPLSMHEENASKVNNTIKQHKSIADEALENAKKNVPQKGAPTVIDGTRYTTKTDNTTGLTSTLKTTVNPDGSITKARYESNGSFDMLTKHPEGKSTIGISGNIHTGEVEVHTMDATHIDNTATNTFKNDENIDRNIFNDPKTKIAASTFKNDGSFNTEILDDLTHHVITSDGNNATINSFDNKNNTVTKMVFNEDDDNNDNSYIEVVDNNTKTTTTTTFDPKTNNKFTVVESSPNAKITTTYNAETRKPLTKTTIDQKNNMTSTVTYNPNESSDATINKTNGLNSTTDNVKPEIKAHENIMNENVNEQVDDTEKYTQLKEQVENDPELRNNPVAIVKATFNTEDPNGIIPTSVKDEIMAKEGKGPKEGQNWSEWFKSMYQSIVNAFNKAFTMNNAKKSSGKKS